ncbi:outer membrane beta-barrel protein [Caulobacter sp. 17J80-11]|uniref:outer membrane beta-barrel protein n=1 Tax=Caulobacter sp. 17J80-11 TaxID=2763502 RepID=UPI0016537ACD|nr:outer membrane beta-barrel protein [Caulobacter sp. 17J80-11]MBC6981459.1 outer membrane beta-barrel protein [Caulobacter sp. 17J80-11]
MKSVLSVSVLVLAAAFAAPAMAADGYLDLNYGQVGGFGTDLDRIQLGGAVSTEVGASGWNVQADAQFSRLSEGGSSVSYSEGAVHAFYRDDRFAAGGYFNVGDIETIAVYGLGIEGKAFFDRATISGSIGYESLEAGPSDADGWDGSLGAKVFITDNFTLGAGFDYADVNDSSVTTWSVGGEFKPDSMPVSFYAGYANHEADTFFPIVGDEADMWKIGVRWNFGGGTLKDRDRSGPTMRTGSSFLNSAI